MRRWIVLASGFALLALRAAALLPLGCSSSGAAGGGDAGGGDPALPPPAQGPPVAAEDWCERHTALACETAQACGCLEALGGTEALCRFVLAADCQDEVGAPVARGALAYDPVRAGQCLAAEARIAADCQVDDDDVRLYEASHCEDFVVGARREGEACDEDRECVAPLRCRADRCAAPPADGAPCWDGTSCADGQFCDADGRCRADVGAGGGCAGVPSACAADLYCDGRTDTCQPEIAVGQPCGHAPGSCADDRYCDGRTDTCQPRIASGEPCAHATWACADDLRCGSADGRCAPWPVEGQVCTPEGRCADDFFCDAGGTCRVPAAVGAPCADDDACASDECEDGRCTEALPEICEHW